MRHVTHTYINICSVHYDGPTTLTQCHYPNPWCVCLLDETPNAVKTALNSSPAPQTNANPKIATINASLP